MCENPTDYNNYIICIYIIYIYRERVYAFGIFDSYQFTPVLSETALAGIGPVWQKLSCGSQCQNPRRVLYPVVQNCFCFWDVHPSKTWYEWVTS